MSPRRRHQAAPRRPGPRGWLGRGRGASLVLDPPEEFRGTSVQVCGLWPFVAGSGTPMVGVPLGRHLVTGATVCCDPISWFQRAALISNPSLFALGKPGLGKSTVIRHMATGLAGYGVMPMVLGDLKPDYVDLIAALGGQVIPLGPGRGHLNVLDPGGAMAAAERLTGSARDELIADARSRRLQATLALLTIVLGHSPDTRETLILDRAMRVLDDRGTSHPVIGDLLQVVHDAPQSVRAVAMDRGDDARYADVTENLVIGLTSMMGGGVLGDTFAKTTTNPMHMDRPVVYDVSRIGDDQSELQAAALLACWSNGFATVNAAGALADAGLEPRRVYFVIMDEIWRALRSGTGMVDRADNLTRLNRQYGVGTAMITHTMSDLQALPKAEDRAKARGFVERSGMVICGGLPAAEMNALTSAVPLYEAEKQMLIGWQDPPAWDSKLGREAEPPGRGKFLIKVGGRPGIPTAITLTDAELAVNDTNAKWHDRSRISGPQREVPA